MRKVVITLLLVSVLSLALAAPVLAVPPGHANDNSDWGYTVADQGTGSPGNVGYWMSDNYEGHAGDPPQWGEGGIRGEAPNP